MLAKNSVFEKFKDKHKGERVFLVANGPSLADTDLSLLKDENTIAMNRISLIYDRHPNWRPTYYVFSSTNVKNSVWGQAWSSSVERAISEPKTTSFIARIFKDYIDPWDEHENVGWFDSMSETKPTLEGEISPHSFSTDVVDRIDKSGTTMNLALQLAYHMGFTEIIFVGADLGWTQDHGSESDPNHFDKSYRANIPNPKKANYQMRNIHSLAKRHLTEKDPSIKMYNASIKTVLDVYPIIDFEKYVKDDELVVLEEKIVAAKEYWDRPPQFT
tara:strand:- start:905 stop:1723 length:819 start_codon:yes stop_codon:yes gene_type:complete